MAGVRVHGTPYSKGSMTCVGPRKCRRCEAPVIHQLIEDDKSGEAKKWRAQLEAAGRALATRNGGTITGPVSVDVTFVFDRPKSAPKRRWPHVRPDVDKLTRMLLDALTSARVIADDALVVELVARKCYPCPSCRHETAGLTVHVEPMVDPDQPQL